MSTPLFKYFFKKNWALWLGFLAFTLFELLAVTLMFDKLEALDGFFGMDLGGLILPTVASVLPMLGAMFTMGYFVFIIFRLLYKPIDSTSLNTHLSAGMKRSTYLNTAAVFLVVSLFVMYTVIFGAVGISMLIWQKINWLYWLNIVVITLFACISVAFISFFFAAAFSGSNIGKLGMIGLPILFALFMFMVESFSAFKYFTPFGWIDGSKIALNTFDLWWLWDLVYLAIAAVFYLASMYMFNRKQLSI